MFLANPGMNRQLYQELFHLNETEAGLVAGLIPKRQILIKRPDTAKVLTLEVDPVSYWLYTNDPFDNQHRREALHRYGFEEGLRRLALESNSRSIP
jgi:type IV secretion system protein VirB4